MKRKSQAQARPSGAPPAGPGKVRRLGIAKVRPLAVAASFVAWGCGAPAQFTSVGLDKKIPKVIVDQQFPASLVSDEAITYDPAFGLVDQQLTLKEKPLLAATLHQLDRLQLSEKYVQGHDGDLAEQEFSISAAGKLDLILVVDNSGSMATKQAELAPHLAALTKNLSNADWQIGILTTDICNLNNNAHPGQPVRKSDSDADANFAATVQGLGTNGSRDEMGIKMALMHLKNACPGGSNSWLRSDAALAVMFVSDEDNTCDTGCLDDQGVAWGPDQLIAQMKAMRPIERLKGYGLLWNKVAPDKGSYNPYCRRDAGTESFGAMYSQVISAFNGIERSICLDNSPDTADYEPLLEQMSKDVSRVVTHEFSLDAEPIPGTAVITIDGSPTADVEITGKKIVLKNASDSQLKLKISYRHDAVARFDKVTLKEAPAPGTLAVQVAGKTVDPSRLTLDSQTQQLTFLDMPPDKKPVTISYRRNLVLPRTFDTKPLKLPAEVVSVLVNGAEAPGWAIDPATGILTLPAVPADGVPIAARYKAPDYRITRYDASSQKDLDKVKRVSVKDAVKGEPIPATFDGAALVFGEDDVVEGRQVVVTYDYGDASDVLQHELSHDPLPNTLAVTSSAGGKSCIGDVAVKDRKVAFTCNAAEIGTVKVAYKYVVERYSSFTIDHDIPDGALPQVFVDKVAIHDFTRTGNTFSIPEKELGLDSEVRILVVLEDGGP